MTPHWRGFFANDMTRSVLLWVALIMLIGGLTGFYILLSETRSAAVGSHVAWYCWVSRWRIPGISAMLIAIMSRSAPT